MDEQRLSNADSAHLGQVPAGAFDAAGMNLPVSQYASASNIYPVESIEIHEQNAPIVSSYQSSAPHAMVFSRRKATIISLAITFLVTILTGVTMLLLTRHAPGPNTIANNQTIKSQDVTLNNAAISKLPTELQGNTESLLINGDITTRGNLKISNSNFVTVLKTQNLTSNQALSLPNASGTICLDSNNCDYATAAQLAQLRQQLGQLGGTTTVGGVSSLNGQEGALSIQGTTNQVTISTSGKTITLTLPQDLASSSSPSFTNLTLSGTLTLPLNCTTFLNGGSLTTNASGQVICSNDETSGAGTSVTTTGGTAGTIPVFDSSSSIVDSIISQSLGTVTISGSLALSNALTVPNGGTGTNTLSANGVLLGNGASAISSLVAGASGQCLVSTAGAPIFQVCPGSGGVSSVNSQNGAVTISSNNSTIAITNPGVGDINLEVVFGSTANTAVQGNTTLTCPSGTGNLTGGGTSITLGTGGACGNLTIVNSPTFSGTLAVQGATITIGTNAVQGSLVLNDGSSNTGTLKTAALGQDTTYTLPDPGQATANVCLSTGNCVGGGSGAAPNGAAYLTIGNDATLSAERAITAGTNLSASDAGANSTYTLSVVNNPTFSGLATLQAGLTISGGTITFSGFNTAGVVHNNASGILSTSAVLLGTDTTGNYVANLGSLTGLSTTGNSGAGSTPTLSVLYGSGANNAAAGSNTFTCTSGTGNLNGGGTTVTLGISGTTCASLDVVASPVFTGTLTVQGASTTIGTAAQQGSLILNDGNGQTATIQGSDLAASHTYTIPVTTVNDNFCLVSLGNCAGSGSGVTASPNGTAGKIAKFTAGQNIGDSTLSESGSTLTASGNVVIQGASALTLGVSGTTDGSVTFTRGAGGSTKTVTLQAPINEPAANLTFKLPSAYGANGDCLQSDGLGGLSFNGCTGGAGGGVTSLNTQTGVVTLTNAGGLTVGSSGAGNVNLAVNYGALANTAVQGNTSLTCPSGTGNLTGGGTSITLGTGGACGNLTVINNPTFSGLLTLQSGVDITGNTTIHTLGTTNTAAYVCLNASNQIASCNTTGSGAAFLQGGNSFGAVANLGTNDNNALNFRTNNATRLTLSTAGDLTFAQASTISTGANTLTVTSSNFNLSSDGVLILAGNQLADITTAPFSPGAANQITIQPGQSSNGFGPAIGAPVIIKGGNQSSSIGGAGGSVQILGGDGLAPGSDGGGSIFIDGGTVPGGIGNGGVYIGTALNNTTVQIGNTNTGNAFAQTINIGNNNAAGSTDNVTIGNLLSTSATTIQGGTGASAVSIQAGSGGTIDIGSTNSNAVNVGGLLTANNGLKVNGAALTLVGNLAPDITTTNASHANVITIQPGSSSASSGGGASLNLKGGDQNGSSCNALNCTGGAVLIQGGRGTGSANTRTGGTVTINAGQGDTANGNVNIGQSNTDSISIGTSNAMTVNIDGGSGINVGTANVANTIQIGNGIGGNAITQTINIGNNNNASSTSNLVLGSTIAGTTTLQSAGGTTITSTLAVQGATTIIGTSSQQGSLVLNDGNGQTATIQGGDLAASHTYTIPVTTSNDTFCLLTLSNCIGGGSGAAPNGAAYLTIGNDATLSAERAITAGTNLSSSDAGANSTYTLSVVNNPTFSGLVTLQAGLDVTGTSTIHTLGTTNTASYLCLNASNQLAACNTTGTGAAFVQGGNSFGAAGDLGTNDGNALNFRTNNATRLTLSTTGNLTFNQASTISTGANALTVTSSNFNVSNLGVVTLAGGQAADVTTAAAGSPNNIIIQPGNTTGGCGACAGAALSLVGGNNSVGIGGDAWIDGGSGVNGAGGLRIGTSFSNFIFFGNTSNTNNVTFDTKATGTITIGSAAQTGNITLGRSTDTNAISIGSAAGNGNTQTINIGNSVTAGSTTNLVLGSTVAGTTTLQSVGGTIVSTLGTANTATYLCRNGSNIIATCNTTGAGVAFVQGGNSFGAAGDLGTNDGNALNLRTNNATRLTLSTTGNLQFAQASTINVVSAATGTALTIQGGAATTGTNVGGNLVLQGGAGASTGASGSVIVKANGNDSTTAFQVQQAGSTAVLTVDTTNSQVKVQGINSVATVGSELLTGNCSGTNWSGTGSGPYTHSSGAGTATLTCTITGGVVSGATYQIVFDVSSTQGNAETITPAIGGVNGIKAIGSPTGFTASITTTSTANPTFTTNSPLAPGLTISNISFKQVTIANNVLAVNNSNATTGLEVRSGGSGLGNSFIGLSAGQADTTGNFNSAVGSGALQSNLTGGSNSVFGYQAAGSGTSASSNAIFGYQAFQLANSSNNVAVGYQALQNDIKGGSNVAVGYQALQSNSYGTGNIAVGYQALLSNNGGGSNTAIGYQAIKNASNASNSVALGYQALFNGSNLTSNTAIGVQSLLANTNGTYDTGVGYLSLGNINGSFVGNNTGLGAFAGYQDPVGFATTAGGTNMTVLGYYAQAQLNNSLILGGQGANAVNVSIGTTSPTNTFSISPDQYDTGTASTTASTTVVGSGTTWTAAMVGSEFVFANGNKYTITAFTDATHLTLSSSSTNGSQAYRIHRPAFQVTSAGLVGIGTAVPTYNLQVVTQTNTTTAFAVQNAAGNNLLNVDTTNANVTIDNSGLAGTIQIGNTTGAVTQTINIGNNATTSSTSNIVLGSTVAGTTTLQSAGGTILSTLGTTNNASFLCRNASNIIAGCNTTGTGAAFVQGGNSFGAQALLGTNDANSLAFETGGTTKATLDTNGNLGIGISNRLSRLTVQQAADTTNVGGTTTANATNAIVGSGTTFTTSIGIGDRISLSSASSTYATVTAITDDTHLTVDIALGNGTSQTINVKHSSLRIDNASGTNQFVVNDTGNVGIGTVIPNLLNGVLASQAHVLTIVGDGSASGASVGVIHLANNRASATSGDDVGELDFLSTGNNGNKAVASIQTFLTGSGGANGFGAAITFNTKDDNVTTFSEKLRLTSAGNLLFNQASSINTASGDLTLQSTNVTANVVVGTSDTNGQLLVVDTKTNAGDPTGVNGGIYYNSNAGKFRCFQNGSWTDCVTGGGGGTAFIQGGNSFGAAGNLGTNDNNALNIRTNGSTRLSVEAGGNVQFNNFVGIGTSPTAPLHVVKTVAAGAGGILNITGNAVNTTDTGDMGLQVYHTISVSSASNQLVTRGVQIATTNNLTGGGTVSNMRTLEVVQAANAGTITTNADTIFVDKGTTAGTVTNGRGLAIAGVQGTNQAGIAINTLVGTNNTLALIGTTAIPVGNYAIYEASSFKNFFGSNFGIGTISPTNLFQVSENNLYDLGTVTTNGTVNLVGTNTQFLNTFKVGDTITVQGETVRTITSITDNTHLAVSVAFSTSASGLTYTLVGGDRFVVQGNGNVGIGLSGTPSALLSVGGTTGNFTVNSSGAVTAQSYNNVRMADQFSGADACAKIAAALADLPSTGGTVDARGLQGAQTCASNPFSGVTKPYRVILGAATYSIGISLTTSAPSGGSNIIEGLGDTTVFSFTNTTAAFNIASNTTLRNFKIDATTVSTAVNGDVFSQATSNIVIDSLTFTGGGHHIQLNNVSDFQISKTHHTSVTSPSGAIFLWQSTRGTVNQVNIGGFTVPASGSAFRAIGISQSSYVNVVSPVIHDIDGSNIPNYAGVSFDNSSNSNLTGGTIDNLTNGDGVLTENGAKDINITGTVSTGNGNSAGVGSNHGVGDGFDIYNSYRINLSDCVARNNGNYSGGRHINIEIYTSSDVTVTNCDASDGGSDGIQIEGTPNTKLIGVRSNRNYSTGVNSQGATGTVNTSGTAVTYASGIPFGLAWPLNTTITINAVNYKISSITDNTHLTLTTSAGTQTGVAFAVQSTFQIIGGQYNDNGVGAGGTGTVEGIYLAQGSTGIIQGAQATDTRASGKTQTYGARVENVARADFFDNDFNGNATGNMLDSVGNSLAVSGNGSSGNLGIGTTNPTSLLSVGSSSQFQVNGSGQVVSGTWQGTQIGAIYGGTGQTSVTTGDLLYGSASNAWSRLGIGSTGNCLTVSGGLPTWGSCAGGSGSGVTLQSAYDNSSSPATITTANNKDIAFTLADTATDSSFVVNLQCTACSSTNGRFAVQSGGSDVLTVFGNGKLRIGTSSDNLTYDGSAGQKFTLNGTARNTKTIALAPEFQNMVLHADGANNNGTITSDYDSGGNHNYYNWTTTQSSAQDYDMYIHVPVPRDFGNFNSGGNTNVVVCYYVWTDDSTPSNSVVTAQLYDTGNVSAGTFTATPTSASTWQQKCSTTQYSVTTVTVNGNTYLTFDLHFAVAQNKNTRIGEITFDYLSTF